MTKGEQITAELQRLSLIVSQRQTPTDQQNGSQTDTNRKADRQTEKLTDTHTHTHTHRPTDRETQKLCYVHFPPVLLLPV